MVKIWRSLYPKFDTTLIETETRCRAMRWRKFFCENTCFFYFFAILSYLEKTIVQLCLKKFALFCDYSIKCWPILVLFSNIVAEEICNQMSYSFLILYPYFVRIIQNRKTRDIPYAFSSMQKPSVITCQFLAAFSKVCSVSAVSNHYSEIT